MTGVRSVVMMICLWAGVYAHGQDVGTKTVYQEPGQVYTAPPAGYTPVFVNYVGRHGARFLTKEGADVAVWKVLVLAEKNDGLSVVGKRVKGITERLLAAGKGNYERITQLGMAEQAGIGERLLRYYPSVFTGRGLQVVTTYKLRTQQSAEAFLRAYADYPGRKRYVQVVDSLDTVLRFYDLSPEYQRYKKGALVKRAMDSLNDDPRTRVVAMHVCSAVFSPAFAARMEKEGKCLAFADDLYDLYSISFSMTMEEGIRRYPKDSIDLGVAFSGKDLEWMNFRDGASDFLEKGPGYDAAGIQVRVARPLLADLVRSMEDVVNGEDSADAVLRFTHAEAISPFAALLGIRQASVPAASIYRYYDHWQAAQVIPLSANVQWVLYSNGKDYLVKVLLNEREVKLPIGGGPYYRWEDLRQYCLQKLAR